MCGSFEMFKNKKVLNFDFVYFFKPENERFYKKNKLERKAKKTYMTL